MALVRRGAAVLTPALMTWGSTVPTAAIRALHVTTPVRERIAVGISGGVDSAVAALLLQREGHDVRGVFMRNWDESEETGNRNCSVEEDARAAAAVCRHLDIPLEEVDFVSQYWTKVFEDFLAQCSRNLTPNPDLACNRFIKFDALVEHAAQTGCDAVATGHYARLTPGTPPALLRGLDHTKDQSYFLATVRPDRLSAARFPLGAWLKSDVRRLAREAGLIAAAERRSSAGICFIGRRRFGDFLEQYLDPVPGEFVDAETGQHLGPCPNLLALTVGQRAGLAGGGARTYVAGKDAVRRVAHVVTGWSGHPALLCRTALLRPAHWLDGGDTGAALAAGATLRLQYKARYGQAPAGCTLRLAKHGAAFVPSQLCELLPQDSDVHADALVAEFDEPATAITPQQAFVVYDGERCLGSALIARPGITLFEQAGRVPVQRPEWLLARG